jgi:hypothetical protein
VADELIENLCGNGRRGASDVDDFGFRGMNIPHVMPHTQISDRLTSFRLEDFPGESAYIATQEGQPYFDQGP